MDPVLAQALATVLGAIATAILMAAGFYFGPNGTRRTEGRRRAVEQAEEE